MALQEPRCSGMIARRTIKSLGFKNYLLSEARGFSGGIWLLWFKADLQVTVIKEDFHFLHVRVQERDMYPWLLTVVYASPQENERRDTWIKLHDIASSIQESWLMMGDFNEIASTDEKKGGASVDIKRCSNFSDWINDCNLLKVHTIGTKFTWRGPKCIGHD